MIWVVGVKVTEGHLQCHLSTDHVTLLFSKLSIYLFSFLGDTVKLYAYCNALDVLATRL